MIIFCLPLKWGSKVKSNFVTTVGVCSVSSLSDLGSMSFWVSADFNCVLYHDTDLIYIFNLQAIELAAAILPCLLLHFITVECTVSSVSSFFAEQIIEYRLHAVITLKTRPLLYGMNK